jgi:hypothetical protein
LAANCGGGPDGNAAPGGGAFLPNDRIEIDRCLCVLILKDALKKKAVYAVTQRACKSCNSKEKESEYG